MYIRRITILSAHGRFEIKETNGQATRIAHKNLFLMFGISETLHPIHLLLKPEENTRPIEVRAVADAMEQADKLRLVADMVLHEVIETKSDQNAQCQHDIQLDIDRAANHVANPPT